MSKKKLKPETSGLWEDQYLIWVFVFGIVAFINAVVMYYKFGVLSNLAIGLIIGGQLLLFLAVIAYVNRCPKCRLPFRRKLYRRKDAGSRNVKNQVRSTSGGNIYVTQTKSIYKYLYRCKSCDHKWSKTK